MPLRPLVPLRARLPVRARLSLHEGGGWRQAPGVTTLGSVDWLRQIEADRARYVRFARARVASDADAEDVVQRALLRAVTHADTLADAGRAEAWFFRVLRRAIADHHRTSAVASARRHEEADETGAGPDLESLPAPEPAAPVCGCGAVLLEEIPASYAEMLRRIDASEEPIEDVARSLGISTATAYVRLHRARRALRNHVEHRCGVRTIREALACDCDACS
jgi:RNA polymerase sigma-70 factor (ECF subfamily)